MLNIHDRTLKYAHLQPKLATEDRMVAFVDFCLVQHLAVCEKTFKTFLLTKNLKHASVLKETKESYFNELGFLQCENS